jgi:aspartyl-tRNA(Asn)/glutamyl-tRNA(Gln) amidotransferase subunit B
VLFFYIHLVKDSGKSVHENGDMTLVDLNRAGVGLLEIITEPEMTSSEEAGAFLRKLVHLLKHINVCTTNMEEVREPFLV